MFKKINILLILLLLFITLSAVSAAEDGDMNLTSDEVITDSLAQSDFHEDISSNEEIDLNANVDLKDELLTSPVVIDNSNYGNYFYNNGTYKGSSSEITLSGSFSNKNFTFNSPVTISGSNSNKLSNSIVTLLSGASGSVVSNLKITNTRNMTYGIFLNSAGNCVIKDCIITNEGKSSYPICLGNGANYNNVTGNKLTTTGAFYGHGTRSTSPLLITGSHHNYIANNELEVDDANAIYLSSYNGGPLKGGDSNFNLIFNNTIHYNVLPTSWSYAIQVMGGYNTIKANKIIGAYRGISLAGIYNNVTQNWIINLTGADYNNNKIAVGGEYAIVGSPYSTITDNHIINAKIISTGSAISVKDKSIIENNYIDVIGVGMGVYASGYEIIIRNNDICTESGVGVYEKDEGSGLLVTRNNITSVSGIGILIEKLSSKRMPSNVTITYNDIKTSHRYAIDARGVENGTGTINNNDVHGKIVLDPKGEYDPSKPSYQYNESKTYTVNQSNFKDYIDDNGHLIGMVDDGVILKFEGTFENKVIHVSKAIKIVGNNALFLNSTFKVTSDNVWIENLTIINKKAEILNAWGIYVNGASGVKILHNHIEVTDPNAAYAIYILESVYVEVISNTLFSQGDFLTYTLLSYSSEDCIFRDNNITTVGTGEKYDYSPESSIEGVVYNVNGTDVCVDGNTICIDGVVYCIDGSDVCIDGNVYSLNGTVLTVNGVKFDISENNTVCIDGNVYCIDGNTLRIDDVTYCLDGSVVCIDGNELVYNGARYPIVDGNVTIDGKSYCIDGSTKTVCIDGVTYCLDGSIAWIDGKTYCLDGNELVIGGTSYGQTNHVVPEILRTYGILLLYSSSNEVLRNNVSVTSALDTVYPTTGKNSSENSIVGIDIYYNSHNNTVSDNYVSITANDNYIYGVGVLGAPTGHVASQGQGAIGNSFKNNVIILNGPYFTEGIVIGMESSDTNISGNIVILKSDDVSYGINLEGSHKSTIHGNDFNLNSDAVYGIEGYNSYNNIVDNNIIHANGKQVYAMAFSGNNNYIANNNVTANGTGEDISTPVHDSLGIGNAGIYLSGNATNNIIKSNNIISQRGFAIVVESSGNTIEDNFLKSEKGNSTEGINGTLGNTVKDNYIYTVTGAFENLEIPYLGSGNIILNVASPHGASLDGAVVAFYDGWDENIGNVTVSDGKAVLYYQLDDLYHPAKSTLDDLYHPAQYPIKAILYKKDFKVTEFNTNELTVLLGNLNVKVTDVSVKDGIKGKFTATVTNALGKPVSGLTVRFYNYDTYNTQPWGRATTDSNGVATIIVLVDKDFAEDFASVTNITAIVEESGYYAQSNGTGLLTIIDIAPITININSKVGFGGTVATIVDNNGLPVAEKSISLSIDGKEMNIKTNANGEIILPSVSAGSHNIIVTSARDSFYDANSASGKVTVVAPITGNKNANVYFGNTVTYKIRVADKSGNYLKANSPVTIKVNNKNVNLKADANGYVSYSIKKVGTYTITVEYNGQKVSNKIVIKPTLTAKNISKKKAKKIKFSVKVVDKKGKAVKKKKVTFKIKGKKYTAKTNKKGVATVTLKNLKVGKHTISSSYGGCTIKNTIKIKK